ncbi:MAG: ABC transporter permease [Emcibacteraceae bacterium]|nr:ABC transporter permease [Emcibacteraceae bacterium]
MLIANYLTSTWRNFLNNVLFSSINILGLAIGLAAVILISLFVKMELSYDSFWDNADNIYRTHIQVNIPGKDPENLNMTPPPLAQMLNNDYSEIDKVTRVVDIETTLEFDNQKSDFSAALVDREFLDIFDLKFIYGDANTALSDNNSLIINQRQAMQYFGVENPVGETVDLIFFDHEKYYRISAVVKDHPENTMLGIDAIALLSESDFEDGVWSGWNNNFVQTYFTLTLGSNINSIERTLPDFINRHYPNLPFGSSDNTPADFITLSFMNMKDLHLFAPGAYDYGPKGDPVSVVSFATVAFLILVIASINFMNLSTARASVRAKEVAIRKVLGAARRNLIFQFIGEAVILTLTSLIIAFAIVEFTLPIYNEMINQNFALDYQSYDVVLIIVFTVMVGIMSGIYPALVISNFWPSKVLKSNKSTDTPSSVRLRSVLVVTQFTISIALIVITAVIFSQMKLTEDLDLGYNKENFLSITTSNSRALFDKIDIIVERLNAINDISSVTYTSNFTPGSTYTSSDPLRVEGGSDFEPIMMTFRGIGYDFLKTYEIPLIVGRDYERNRNDERPSREQILAGDGYTASLILNVSAVRRLGFSTPEEALGKRIFMNVGMVGQGSNQVALEADFEVIGVIDDVRFSSLKTPTEPEFYQLKAKLPQFVNIRYTENPMKVVEEAKAIWQEEMPGASFEYEFAKDALADQYKTEHGQINMFSAFSGLAIFIACLGLFGLASFTAERRTKEIGIRKVFGAKIFQIIKLLVWQFSKPVLIANLIAWPIAYLAMSRWLESFVYRVDSLVIVTLCLMAGFIALLIAWVTVAGNSFVVARKNPIDALRHE